MQIYLEFCIMASLIAQQLPCDVKPRQSVKISAIEIAIQIIRLRVPKQRRAAAARGTSHFHGRW